VTAPDSLPCIIPFHIYALCELPSLSTGKDSKPSILNLQNNLCITPSSTISVGTTNSVQDMLEEPIRFRVHARVIQRDQNNVPNDHQCTVLMCRLKLVDQCHDAWTAIETFLHGKKSFLGMVLQLGRGFRRRIAQSEQ
jgi:hypothetical protein